MYLKTNALVLREVAYQDADKLLTLLTQDYGCLTARARGVRSRSSREGEEKSRRRCRKLLQWRDLLSCLELFPAPHFWHQIL